MPTAVKMARADSTGLDRGSTIWKKMRYSLAPSIFADSKSVSGMAL